MSRRFREGVRLLAFCACLVPAGTAQAQTGPGREAILSERSYLRQYYRFGADRVSPDLLKSEGEKLLGAAGLARVRNQTETRLRQTGTDPSTARWQDHVVVRLFFDDPKERVGLAPPEDWASGSFDDHDWILERGPVLPGSAGGRQPLPKGPGWTQDDLDQEDFANLGIRSCHYRGRFVLDDPAKLADLTLRLAFRGGARAWLNGQEIARFALPEGRLTDDAPAEVYPPAAYQQQAALRDRVLGPVRIPPSALRKGVNVLAVEVRASPLHPIVLGMKLPLGNHKVRQGMEGLWPHVGLTSLELGGESGQVATAATRPAEPRVWVQDVHHRVESTEFPCPGEDGGRIRIVAVRNGVFSAQIVVAAGGQAPLADLKVSAGDLRRAGGVESLPGGAVQVLRVAPYPAALFNERELGDDRGLGASFPDNDLLARHESMADANQAHLFDHLTQDLTADLPAGACRPIWLSLKVPADAAPGKYQGAVQVKARGLGEAQVPMEVEVLDWRLPDPRAFATFVGCEENPYAVARQYGVKLWSDEHFRLLEASFRQLGRIGNGWVNVPVISRTEFGNRDDSMVRWVRRKDGSPGFDYSILDRYLDLVGKTCRPPRVINFVVMQGMPGAADKPAAPAVKVLEEATGKTIDLPLGGPGIGKDDKRKTWGAFAKSLYDHMQSRGQAPAMCWGYPLEQEADPELKRLLEEFTPAVSWAANPHELLWNATYAKDRHYKVITTIRYQAGARSLASFRTDQGWRSELTHLLSPRTGGNIFALHTVSFPFAFRVLSERAVASGHSGIARVGADEWAAVHYDGMEASKWLTGMPVLFVLWPGKQGAESSVRFEMLLEGIQETEARIFLEKAVAGGRLPADLSRRVGLMLSARIDETRFFPATLCVHELEKCHFRWQERSRQLYQAAAEAARFVRG